ncbi:uncharacterized protein LOC100277536 [Zea mays]|uniref:DUF1664 domain-containing protein n=1 Tax=Zea mays TaxID=4577 RepID=B6TVY1_MAIZE|nr:uncharacterized protein LOC100277536 [Zea mays]ACG41264.1 hypothetical protein [Zea mays]ONM29189.1 hypothetical protein ZEAMMB73_Zm00001d039549 [Zea mays]|eukprot:NP_001144539.1 uncharacterized protein LOC100277536 [Zea mays]
MAMVQAGMGLGRIVLLIGVGAVGGPIAVRSGKLGELLRDLQESLSEKGAAAVNDDVNTVVAKALAQMTKEINHIATRISQPMIHVDTGNGVAASALIVPAAAVGTVGYCYMWWKGISFSSLMYVTKRNMANAVESMTKHLEQVQSSLAAAKKHLSQRIQNVDDKLEQQKEISVQIKDQVIDAKLKFKNIGSDMDKLKNMVMGLDDKMDSIEAKQNYSCVAVDYLCQFIEERVDKLPEQLEGLQQTVKRIGYRSPELPPGLGGLQQLLATGSATHSSTRMLRSTGAARLILP